MSERIYGRTKTGKPITDATIEGFAHEAEQGYDAGQLESRRRGRGRPPLGAAAKVVESVRFDPMLRTAIGRVAEKEGVTVSEVIREAVGRYVIEQLPSGPNQDLLDHLTRGPVNDPPLSVPPAVRAPAVARRMKSDAGSLAQAKRSASGASQVKHDATGFKQGKRDGSAHSCG